jgi:hypothetical protein
VAISRGRSERKEAHLDRRVPKRRLSQKSRKTNYMKIKKINLSDIRKNKKLSFSPKDYIRKKMIDPPSGWVYGFPKEIPENGDNVEEWLIKNGYPQSIIEKFKENDSPFPYRVWYE